MPFFDDDDPASIEEEYIDRIVPRDGHNGDHDLWQRSIDESPVWDSMTPEQHMEVADKFAEAVYGGSLADAEDFLGMLQIDWDDDDISDFWDLYDQVAS